MKSFSIITQEEGELVDITQDVQSAVESSGVRHGLCTVFITHTSAAVTVMEVGDPDFSKDFLNSLERAIPKKGKYAQDASRKPHERIKSAVVDPHITLIVDHGRLVLGQWQGVVLCDFDGPRDVGVHTQVVGS